MAKKKPAAKKPEAELAPPKRVKVKAAEVLGEFPVKFGAVSIGKKTGKVSFSIQRQFCQLSRADELFVDRRLRAKAILGRSADAAGQTAFIPADVEVSAEFDVKGFRVGSDAFTSMGLTFMLKEVSLEDVSHLSGGTGRLVVTKVSEIPSDAVDEPFVDDPDQQLLPSSGPWTEIPIKEAMPKITPALVKSLAANGITTVGTLADWTKAHGEFWAKDLGGVGPAGREKLEKWDAEFWQRNPQYAQT